MISISRRWQVLPILLSPNRFTTFHASRINRIYSKNKGILYSILAINQPRWYKLFARGKRRERERVEKHPAVSVHVHGIHRLGSDKRGQRLGRKDGESLRGRNVTAACPRAPLLSKLIRCAKGMMKLTVARGHGKADAEPLHLRCIKAIHPDAWRTVYP